MNDSPLLRYYGVEPKEVIRVIVAGTRKWVPEHHFDRHIRRLIAGIESPTVKVLFVSGMAKTGADKQIVDWCDAHSYEYEPYPADWDAHPPKTAGFIRNEEMAKVGDILLAFWDGESRGTADMRKRMFRRKKLVITIIY